MSEKQSRVQTVEKLFLYFLMAAVIGWCYKEVFLEVVVYRWGFDNRGVLLAPIVRYTVSECWHFCFVSENSHKCR